MWLIDNSIDFAQGYGKSTITTHYCNQYSSLHGSNGIVIVITVLLHTEKV